MEDDLHVARKKGPLIINVWGDAKGVWANVRLLRQVVTGPVVPRKRASRKP